MQALKMNMFEVTTTGIYNSVGRPYTPHPSNTHQMVNDKKKNNYHQR